MRLFRLNTLNLLIFIFFIDFLSDSLKQSKALAAVNVYFCDQPLQTAFAEKTPDNALTQNFCRTTDTIRAERGACYEQDFYPWKSGFQLCMQAHIPRFWRLDFLDVVRV